MSNSTGCPVVVIGAGASGLAAIKACLEENLEVICFEKTDTLGGLWRYRDEVIDGVASVMKSTIINTSKEMTAYSDFPPPADFPNFMHNKYYVRYLDMYAEHFRLAEHVRCNTEVLKVERAPDFADTGSWIVRVRTETGEVLERKAMAVMVCTGHHCYPYWPTFPGLGDFKGSVIHANMYRDIKGFEDKNVLVVGIGNSGGDTAVELSHVANKVYLSTRRGTWVLPRLGDYGIPLDIQYGRRHIISALNLFPDWLKNLHAEFKLNSRYDHSLYNLKPRHRFYSQHPMVNDALPSRLLSGSIVLKGNVDRFTNDGVVFEGDSPMAVHSIDVVVLATGYNIHFPFLDADVMNIRENRLALYKHVFPPDMTHSTLAFIGLIQPFGALPPISEVQARWVSRIWKCQQCLPPMEAMHAEIAMMQHRHDKRYVATRRHTIEVDSIPYMDEIAALAGVKPKLSHLLLWDPKLFWACLFGPCLPYQYRLFGPHSWSGARQAILEVDKRITAPLNTRALGLTSDGAITLFQKTVLSGIILFFFILISVILL